jgi:type II secretory pathway pseudopilin PulG
MRLGRGYSVLEFLIAVALIGALMLAFLDRIDFYRESAEKAAMEQLAREIGWALRIRAAELMLASQNDEIGKLDGANPITALDMQIANYAGAGDAAAEAEAPPGRWFFNRDARELVYLPSVSSNFVSASGGRPRVAWRVVVVRQANQPGGKPKPQWVRLELTMPYRWLDQARK